MLNCSFPRTVRGASPQTFAGTDKGCCSLELLDRQQPQRVAHQHRDPAIAARVLPGPLGVPQTAQRHREGSQSQVRLRLATARGKPQQVNQLAIGGLRIDDTRQVQEDESDLKGTPSGSRSTEHSPLTLLIICSFHGLLPL